MATNRFLIVSKYAVGSNRGLSDVDLVDTRVRGGGIKEELVTDFKGSYPQIRWFHDIGHYDGTPFPGATAVLVDLPATLLEVNGGIFNKKQIDSITKHHLSFGIYPVIRFYCTNTGLVKHEDVSNSSGPGIWDVPDSETCPDEDGTVLCTLVTTTTTTTYGLLGFEMVDYIQDFDSDDFYWTSLGTERTWNAVFLEFEDPVNAAAKIQLEIRTRHDFNVPRWWTNIGGITPDPSGGESIQGLATGSFENILGSVFSAGGPWSAAELANLRLFMEQSTGALTNLDLSGVRIHLYDAGDVLLETVYPNGIYSDQANIYRSPQLDTAPSGYQWVDRTSDTYWTGNANCVWNAGGWWDIGGGTAQLSSIGESWNDNLRPLAFRLTHDVAPSGDVRGGASAVTYGKRWTYTSLSIIDLAEVDDWAQDFEIIEWLASPAGAKVTKVEVLEPI